MPSVATHNLGTAIAQIAGNSPGQAQQSVPQQNASLSTSQLAAINRIATERQLLSPPRSDKSRSPSQKKQIEGIFAAQERPAQRQPEEKIDPESRSRPRDDGLMDVVA
jgi:hypothetical protein